MHRTAQFSLPPLAPRKFRWVAAKLVAATSVGCLIGCAAQVVSSSARTVVVRAPDNAIAKSQALADAECKKHGRFARMIDRPSARSAEFVFDCVQ